MKRSLRPQHVILTLLACALGAYVLSSIDLASLRRLSGGTLALVLAIAVLFVYNHALGGSLILRGLGAQATAYQTGLIITAAGTLSTLGNLAVGLPARILLYRMVLSIPVAAGAVAVVLETAIWLLLMAVIIILPVPGIWGPWAWRYSATGAALGLLGLGCVLSIPHVVRVLPAGWRIPLLGRIVDFLGELAHGIRTSNRLYLAAAGAVFAFNYVLDGISLRLVLGDLGFQTGLLELVYSIVLSYLVGLLSMVPMGLGPRDVSLTLCLVRLGATKEVAALAVLIQRLMRTAVPVALGAVSVNLLGVKALELSAPPPEPGGSGAS